VTNIKFIIIIRTITDEQRRNGNGPINRGSQSGVSMVTYLRWKGFTEKVSFDFRVKGLMDGESGEKKDGLR